MSRESPQIHPAALEEAETAVEWYAHRSTRAAAMFLEELDSAVDRLGENPQLYPHHEFGTRRLVLRRFPFVIVFRNAPTGILA